MDVLKQTLRFYSVCVIHFVLFYKLVYTVPYFTLDITYSNLNCPTVTVDLGITRSELDCLVRCHRLGQCRGFFYNIISLSCNGTTVSIGTTALCTTMSGNIYYAATNDLETTTPTTTIPDTTSTVTPGTVSTVSVASTSASITSAVATTNFVTSTPLTTTTTNSVTSTPSSATTSRSTTTFTSTTTTTTATTTSTMSTTSFTTTPIVTTSVNPTAAYGTPCSSDSDCGVPYTECISDKCQCSPGFRLLPDSQTCTTNCPSFGTSFIRLRNTILDSPTIVLHMGVSVSQCKLICSSSMYCSGINYCNSCGGMCRCKAGPSVYDPSNYQYMSGVDHYSRNCG